MPNPHKFSYEKGRIPKIENLELTRRLKLVHPCIEKENEIIKITNYGDPIKQSFSWDYKEGEVIGHNSHTGISAKDRPAENGGWYLKPVAEKIGEFITLHNFGYHGFYKPSIEEILAQLPTELFDEDKLAGRKLYFINKMISSDINTSLLDGEYHIAKTRVYIDII